MSRKTGKPSYTQRLTTPGTPARSAGQVWRAISALVVAAVVGLFVGVQVAGPSAAESAVAELREQEARRDAVQIKELTARARETATTVTPLVDGLAAGAPEVTDEQLAQWQAAIDAEMEWYAVTVSGTTATNVARGGLRTAVAQLAAAVDAYTAARAAPESSRLALLQLATQQRDLAVMTWSVAATQLDQINIDAGNGHQHVYLDTTGVGAAMTGDGQPEGTSG